MKTSISKKLFKLLPVLAVAFFINSITFMQVSKAQENEAFKSAGKWLVGLKVLNLDPDVDSVTSIGGEAKVDDDTVPCLLYTSPSPRDATLSRMPSSA